MSGGTPSAPPRADARTPDPASPPVSLDPLLPPQMARRAEEVGVSKARMPLINLFVLAVLAGAFIALGAEFFTL